MIFLTFSLVFTFGISRCLHGLTMPRWFGVLDTIGVAVLGLLVAGTAATVAALLLSVLVQALQAALPVLRAADQALVPRRAAAALGRRRLS